MSSTVTQAEGSAPTHAKDGRSEPTALATVDAERAEIVAELAQDPEKSRLSFCDWYLSVLGNCDAAEDRLKAQYERIRASIQARRRALEFRWGRDFRAKVEEDLSQQKGKKKSVDYLTGRAGFRKSSGRVIFLDAAALEAWCIENLPEAIKYSVSATAIRDHIMTTGEIPPGVEWAPAQDRFYPTVEQKALTEEEPDGQ